MAFVAVCGASAAPPRVRILRLAEGGVQPVAAVDGAGVVHVIFFEGEARAGDVYYMKSSDGGATFCKPMRVNALANSAVALGSVRGPQMALGRNGRVHVVWNGSEAVNLKAKGGGKVDEKRTPLLYTRLKEDGSGFEHERNMIQHAFGLDGGSAVAADDAGHVYIVWHAPEAGQEGEAHRRVWVAKSSDDGATFAPERAVNNSAAGCCGCCSLNAFCAKDGSLQILYRSATAATHRDMHLLVSRDGGEHFDDKNIDQWEAGQCVMSTSSFAQLPDGDVCATWETRQRVRFAPIDGLNDSHKRIAPADQTDNAKHPRVAVNSRGETLLAWTEGTAWNKGGCVAWQVFDKSGGPLPENRGRTNDLPVWGTVAVFADKNSGFVIVY